MLSQGAHYSNSSAIKICTWF